MTVHLSTNKTTQTPICLSVSGEGSKVTTNARFADCLECFRAALHQSKSGLQVIKGVLAEALPD